MSAKILDLIRRAARLAARSRRSKRDGRLAYMRTYSLLRYHAKKVAR
jgi:hypothetical protein